MVQHLREPRVRHVAADHLRHRPAHAQRHHVAQGVGVEVGAEVQRVEHILDRFPEEEPLRHVVQGARHLLEPAVALAVALARRKRVHGARHRADLLLKVDARAVGEKAAPLRVQPEHRQVAFLLAPRLGVDAPQHAGHGEDRRPHVEAEHAGPVGAGRWSTAALPPSQAFLSSRVTRCPRAAATAAAASPPSPPPTTTTCLAVMPARPSPQSMAASRCRSVGRRHILGESRPGRHRP